MAHCHCFGGTSRVLFPEIPWGKPCCDDPLGHLLSIHHSHGVHSVPVGCTVLPWSAQCSHGLYSALMECTMLCWSVQCFHGMHSAAMECTVLWLPEQLLPLVLLTNPARAVPMRLDPWRGQETEHCCPNTQSRCQAMEVLKSVMGRVRYPEKGSATTV